MKRLQLALIVLFSFSLVIACSNTEEFYAIEQVGSTKYVHNLKPAWGDNPEVSLEFVQKIGERPAEEDTEGNYLLYRVYDVTKDNAGNIYILDSGNNRVQKFDAKGEYIKTIGGPGQGPGEFSLPYTLGIVNNAQLYVGDNRNLRVQFFDFEGNFQRVETLDQRFELIRILNSGEAVIRHNLSFSGDEIVDSELSKQTLFAKRNFANKTETRFGTMHDFTSKLESQAPLGNHFVNRVTYDIDDNDNIYVNFAHWNAIEKYSASGELLLRIDRPLRFTPDHRVVTNNGKQSQRYAYVSDGIGTDTKGRIWVLTYSREPEAEEKISDFLADTGKNIMQIFSKDGILLGEIPAPDFNSLTYGFRITDNSIFFLVVGDSHTLYEYKIVEKY